MRWWAAEEERIRLETTATSVLDLQTSLLAHPRRFSLAVSGSRATFGEETLPVF